MRMKQVSMAALALAIAALAGCGGFKAERSVTQQLDAPQGERLEIVTRNGSVTVLEDANLSAVSIVADLRGRAGSQDAADQRVEAAEILVAEAGSTVSISAAFPEGYRNGDGASFTIRTPAGWREAIVRSSNGAIRIEGLSAPSDLDTSNGSVTVLGQTGDAKIDTSNGRINIVGLDGAVIAETSNGSMTFEDISGAITAESSNGSITIAMVGDQAGPFAVSSSNGSAKIRLGDAFHGVVEARTSNGSMSMRGDRITAIEMLSKRHGRATIGEGGAASTVRTSNGSVSVTSGS